MAVERSADISFAGSKPGKNSVLVCVSVAI